MILKGILTAHQSHKIIEIAGAYSCRLTLLLVISFALFSSVIAKAQSSHITLEFYNDSQVKIKENIYFRLLPLNIDGVWKDSVCRISLPSNVYVEQFEIQLKGGGWEVYKPQFGRFSNTNKDEPKKIFLRRIETKTPDKVEPKLDSLIGQTNRNHNELMVQLDSTNSQFDKLGNKMDIFLKENNKNIKEIATKENDITKRENDLVHRELILRDTLWNSIDTVVYNYLSRVKDYETELNFLKESLFYSPDAVSGLNKRIRLLDQSYEALNKNYNTFISMLKAHFELKLYDKTKDYLDELLNDFHNDKLKTDGNNLFFEIGKYSSGAKKAKKKKELKEDMTAYISMLKENHKELLDDYEKLREKPAKQSN